jgi:DNA-binding NarL/FixJ family response regulator
MNIKIIIADDHKLFAEGLVHIINEIENTQLIATAGNGRELLQLMNSHQPNLVLLDINMPVMNGLEALKELKKRHPQVRVIILSMHYEKYMVSQVMQDGAEGYLIKTSDKEEFKTAIKRVCDGGKYFSADLTTHLLSPQSITDSRVNLLSRREIEIIALLADGLGSAQIGDKMSISPRTADTHRNNILQKLGLRNTAELISFAFKNKLLDT